MQWGGSDWQGRPAIVVSDHCGWGNHSHKTQLDANRIADSPDSSLLAHNTFGQRIYEKSHIFKELTDAQTFHMQQFVALTSQHVVDRDACGARHDGGNVRRCHSVAEQPLLIL